MAIYGGLVCFGLGKKRVALIKLLISALSTAFPLLVSLFHVVLSVEEVLGVDDGDGDIKRKSKAPIRCGCFSHFTSELLASMMWS